MVKLQEGVSRLGFLKASGLRLLSLQTHRKDTAPDSHGDSLEQCSGWGPSRHLGSLTWPSHTPTPTHTP